MKTPKQKESERKSGNIKSYQERRPKEKNNERYGSPTIH
jgi:hypothetical protein